MQAPPPPVRFLFEPSRKPFPFFLFLVSAIAAASLGGCGGGAGGTSGSSGTVLSPTPSATAASATVASPTPSPTPTSTASPAAIVLNVAPASVTVNVNATTTFVASVAGTNASQAPITWSVQESGGGTITSNGVYSAPPVPGTYHIIAAVQTASVPVGVATVFVQAGNASGVIQ